MNLQELLGYRTHCVIHGEQALRPYCAGTAMILDLNKDGLSLTFSLLDRKGNTSLSVKTEIILKFNFDGTYQVFDRQFVGDIIVYMMCDTCKTENFSTPFREGSSLTSLNQNKYFYNFVLKYSPGEEIYQGNLIGEIIRHTRNNKFYHITKNHVNGETNCKMGTNEPQTTLDNMLKGMLNLKLPSMDLTKIRDIDHLVEKIKLYNLFS
jgi:hypothetical protein